MNTLEHSQKCSLATKAMWLALIAWLLVSQVLVFAHEAGHSHHLQSQYCDDLHGAGKNTSAAFDLGLTANLERPAIEYFQSTTDTPSFSNLLSYHARAPPII